MLQAICALGTQRAQKGNLGELIALAIRDENGAWIPATQSNVPEHQAIFTFHYEKAMNAGRAGLFTTEYFEATSTSSSRTNVYQTESKSQPRESRRDDDIYSLLDVDSDFDPNAELQIESKNPTLKRCFVRFLRSAAGDKPIIAGPFSAKITKLPNASYQVKLDPASASTGGMPDQNGKYVFDVTNHAEIIECRADYNDQIWEANFVINFLSNPHASIKKYRYSADRSLILERVSQQKDALKDVSPKIIADTIQATLEYPELPPKQRDRLSEAYQALAVDLFGASDWLSEASSVDQNQSLAKNAISSNGKTINLSEHEDEVFRLEETIEEQSNDNLSLRNEIESLKADLKASEQEKSRLIDEKRTLVTQQPVLSKEEIESLRAEKEQLEKDSADLKIQIEGRIKDKTQYENQIKTLEERIKNVDMLTSDVIKQIPVLKLFNLIQGEPTVDKQKIDATNTSTIDLSELYAHVQTSFDAANVNLSVDLWKIIAAVESGLFTGLYGPPGTGKTALANALSRVFAPKDYRLQHAVDPNWTSSSDAFGSFNPFVNKFVWNNSELQNIFSNENRSEDVYRVLTLDEAALSNMEEYLFALMQLDISNFDTVEEFKFGPENVVKHPGLRVLFTLNPTPSTKKISTRIKDRTFFIEVINDQRITDLGSLRLDSLPIGTDMPRPSSVREFIKSTKTSSYAMEQFEELLIEFVADNPIISPMSQRLSVRVKQFAKVACLQSDLIKNIEIAPNDILDAVFSGLLLPRIEVTPTNLDNLRGSLESNSLFQEHEEVLQSMIDKVEEYGAPVSLL